MAVKRQPSVIKPGFTRRASYPAGAFHYGRIRLLRSRNEALSAEARLLKLNRTYALLSEINKTIVSVRDPQALLDTACSIAVEHGGFRMAWIGLFDPQTRQVKPVASAGITADYLEKLHIVLDDSDRGRGPTASAIHNGTHYVVNDIASDERMLPWRADALQLGYRASAVLTLCIGNEVRGTLNLYTSEPGFFDDDELKLLDNLAADIAFAMEFAEREEKQKLTQEAIRQSERQWENIFEAISDSVCLLDHEGRIIKHNRAMESLVGKPPGKIEGRHCYEVVHGTSKPIANCPIVRMMLSKRRENLVLELNGRWFNVTVDPILDDNGKLSGAVHIIQDISAFEFAGLTKIDLTTIYPIAGRQGRVELVGVVCRDITERKRMEEELQKSERTLRLIAKNATDVIYAYDMHRRLIYVNPALEELTGYTATELEETNYINWLYPEDEAKMVALWEDLFAGKGFSAEEFRIVTKDGQTKWCLSSWGPLYDESGRQIGVQGRERDITGRKRVEEALRRSEARYRDLFDHINSGVAVYEARAGGADFVFTDFNQAGERIDKIKKEDLIGKSVIQSFPGVKEFGLFDVLQRVWKTGEAEYLPISLYKDERIVGWRENYIYKLPSGEIVAVYDYLTERKQAEEQLRYQAALLANVNDAIVASDAQDRLTAWNAAAEALFGWKAEEVLGRNGLEIIRTEWPGVEAEEMRRTIAEIGRWRGEVTQARRDGTRFPVEVSSIVLRDERGQITGYVSVNRDITERKRAEEEIQNLARFPSENPNPILRIARDGTLLYINDAGLRLLPQWHLQVGQASPAMLREIVSQSMDNGSVQVLDLEHDARVYSFFVSPTVAAGYTNLYARDITEHRRAIYELKRSQEQLRALSLYWLNAIEAERAYIAREIHDEFGQSMTALKMDLTWLTNRLPKGDERAMRIRGMNTLVDDSIRLMQRIASSLRPGLLDDLGLSAALEWQAAGFSNRTGIVCKVSLPPDDLNLDPALKTTLFRIFQEILTNVARHAQATRVDAILQQEDQILIMTIRDNGRGISKSELKNPRSLGLLGMRERATQWGGEIDILGAAGEGTIVTVSIPLTASTSRGGSQ